VFWRNAFEQARIRCGIFGAYATARDESYRMKSLFAIMGLLFSIGNVPAFSQIIVGHRGASFDAPENTLSAFKAAWDQNADGIEADFYVTKDGHLVCIHDANTLRTTGYQCEVADSTLTELRQYEYGAWKDPIFRGEAIPTFADVLAVVPSGKRFVIELKTGPEIVPFLKTELDRLKPETEQLLIIAFKKETIAACKETLPHIKAHWLTGYKQDKRTGAWTPPPDEVIAGLRQSKADGLGLQGNLDIVNAALIEHLRAHGLKEFHVWTIDLPDEARYFRELGAMGITTNRPGFIREQLME
jgi:glycerophosphoryl diester phosphodiesterase